MAHRINKPPQRTFGSIKDQIYTANLSRWFRYKKPVRSNFLVELLVRSGILRDYSGAKILWLDASSKNRLLDIGCGTGGFLSRMENLGWSVSGIEPDDGAVAIARERIGSDRIHHGTVENVNLPSESFDAITLSHVIEHLPDPLNTLKRCRSLLKPDGKIIIYTPNLNSFGHHWFKDSWVHLDPPRHLFLFSKKALQICTTEAKLSTEKIIIPSSGAKYVWSASSIIRNKGHLPDGKIPQPLSRLQNLKSLGFMAIEAIISRLKPVGEEVVVIATKTT